MIGELVIGLSILVLIIYVVWYLCGIRPMTDTWHAEVLDFKGMNGEYRRFEVAFPILNSLSVFPYDTPFIVEVNGSVDWEVGDLISLRSYE